MHLHICQKAPKALQIIIRLITFLVKNFNTISVYKRDNLKDYNDTEGLLNNLSGSFFYLGDQKIYKPRKVKVWDLSEYPIPNYNILILSQLFGKIEMFEPAVLNSVGSIM